MVIQTRSAQSRLFFILLLLACLLGMGLIVYATRFGPGIGGDATIYLTTARNLLAGKGLTWPDADGTVRLLPYTPPFYPLVLSGLGLVVKDLVAGARWLNVLFFGLTIFLTGWFFYRFSGRGSLALLLAGALATSPVMVGVEVWAMSEAIFLLLGAATLFCLLDYLDCPRPAVLVGSALLAGLAFLTRYMGVAYVATGGLALLLFERGASRKIRLSLRWPALRETLLFGVIAILPTLVWLIIDFIATGTVGSRSGQPAAAYWQRFLEMGPALEKIYLFWLLPDSVIARLPGVVSAALWLIPLVVVIALSVMLDNRMAKTPVADMGTARANNPTGTSMVRLAALFGLFILVYLAVLAVVQVFTYPPITLASRMLSPVHLAVLVLIFALLGLTQGLFAPSSRIALGVVYLAGLALFGMYGLRGGLVARDYHNKGIGYTAPEWQQSSTVAKLCTLPANIPIISNETTALMFFANRTAYPIQEIYLDRPQEPFTIYGAGDDPAQRAFREQGGALVLFKGTLADDFAMYGNRVDERLQVLTRGLYPYFDGPDGSIYFASQPSFTPGQNCK